jgi:hypothetical protein
MHYLLPEQFSRGKSFLRMSMDWEDARGNQR